MSESQTGQPSADFSSDAAAHAARADQDEAQRPAASPFVLSQEPVTEAAPDLAAEGTPAPDAPPAPAYEHLGDLPATYGTQSVYLVAYDPKQLFAYWDVDWSAALGASYGLRVCRADGQVEAEPAITPADTGRYLPVAVPGGTYYVELGTRGRDGSWNPVAHSGRVTMPPEGLAGEDEPKFATLPFHLSFQRLLELIQGAMGNGEDLTAALARLQQGDRTGMQTISDALPGLGTEQMRTLETILGHRFSVNSAGDTEMSDLPRDRADVLSAEAFSSGGLSSAGLIGPAGGMDSGTLSSGRFGGDTTLRAFAAGMNSETLSSFAGPRGASGSEAWRLAKAAGPGAGGGSSDLAAGERSPELRRAIEHNLRMLGALFSAVNAGLGGGSANGSSPGRW